MPNSTDWQDDWRDLAQRWEERCAGRRPPMYGMVIDPLSPTRTILLKFADGSTLTRPYSWYLYTRYVCMRS